MGFNLFIFVPYPQTSATTTSSATAIVMIIIASTPYTRKKLVLEAINPSSMLLHELKREQAIFQVRKKSL